MWYKMQKGFKKAENPLSDIEYYSANYENITHILNITVSHELRDSVYQYIYDKLANKVHTNVVSGINVSIQWKTNMKHTNTYYAYVSMFTDVVVMEHARQLLSQIIAANSDLCDKNIGLTFMITKPSTGIPQAYIPPIIRPGI